MSTPARAKDRPVTMTRCSMLALLLGAALGLSACSQWGYVFANKATTPSYTPNANNSLNSGGSPTTITRTGAGTYVVHFTGLSSSGGVVHVTPSSSADSICTVGSWSAVSGGVDVAVHCFGTGGHPRDTIFEAIFAAPQPPPFPHGQLWAQQSASAVNVPYTPAHSLNSAGGTNSVTRTDTGSYVVLLPGLGRGDLGNLKVTAVATAAVVCNPVIMAPDGNFAMRIVVVCVDASGTAVNSAFTLTWTTQNLLGDTRASAHIAYFTAGGVASTFNSTGGTNSVVENSLGVFTVTFGGLAGSGGNVQAQVFGGLANTGAPGNCTAVSSSAVGADEVANVHCFDMAGSPADPIILLVHFVR